MKCDRLGDRPAEELDLAAVGDESAQGRREPRTRLVGPGTLRREGRERVDRKPEQARQLVDRVFGRERGPHRAKPREADLQHREVVVAQAVERREEEEVGRLLGVAERMGATRPAELRALDVELGRERVDDGGEHLAGVVGLQVPRKAVEDPERPGRGAHVVCTCSVTLTVRTNGCWSSAGWISLFGAEIRRPSSTNSAVYASCWTE